MTRKYFTFLLLVSLLFASNIFSQSLPSGTGRYEALGYNPFMTDPAYDLNRNPAWGHQYRNYAFGDIGRADLSDPSLYKLKNQYAGFDFGLGKNVFAGFIVNREDGMIFDSVFNVSKPWGLGALGINLPIVPLKAFFGFNTSDKFTLALSLYYAQKSQDSTLPVTNSVYFDTTGQGIETWFEKLRANDNKYNVSKSSSVFGITLGTLGRFKGGWIEGNIDLKFNKFKYSGNWDTTLTHTYYQRGLRDSVYKEAIRTVNITAENDGALEFNAATRAMLMISKENNISLVPYFNIGLFSWKPTYNPADSRLDSLPVPKYRNTVTYDYKYSYLNINGGVGINMPVFSDGLLAFGVSLGYNSFKLTSTDISTRYTGNGIAPGSTDTLKSATTINNDYKYSRLLLPKINVGLEWKFTNWLTGRFGYSRSVVNEKTNQTSTVTNAVNQISSDPNLNNRLISSTTLSNPGNVINNQNPTDPVQTISLGMGFHFDRFSLDGMIGEKFFQKGINLLSGQDDKEMFGVLSASYYFNK